MSDQALRQLQRSVASGDLHAQARLLVERLRVADPCGECAGKGHTPPKRGSKAGRKDYMATCEACAGFRSVARARVALAAVCGHPAAYEAIEPFTHRGHWDQPLAEWLPLLSRWSAKPFHAPVRAGYAAAHLVAAHLAVKGMEPMQRIYELLDAVEGWLVEPYEENRLACSQASVPLTAPFHYLGSFINVAHGVPANSPNDWTTMWQDPYGFACNHPGGESAIRTAIQQALVKFALGP